MPDRPAAPERVRRMLALARSDRAAARDAVARLSLDEMLALVCEAPVAGRSALLDLLPEPERVIPLIPEAELCFTVKAVGLSDASWLLEHATPAQVVACLDLDAWSGTQVDRARLDAWLAALAETEDDSFLRSVESLDPELLVLFLKDRIHAVQKPSESEDPDWQAPPGSQTLDGVFHFSARREGDDLAALARLLHLLFQRDYWSYFRLMQGTIWELESDAEEWALRWRTGRLMDLGFPPWDEAMSVYRFVGEQDRSAVPEEQAVLSADEWPLPVWMPGLPAGAESRLLLFRAIARLDEKERRAAFFAFVAVANKVAVADRMDLADAESTPRAIEKAATWISRGLEFVSGQRSLDPTELLRRLSLERLFRVGASLDPAAARPRSAHDAPTEAVPDSEDTKGPPARPAGPRVPTRQRT